MRMLLPPFFKSMAHMILLVYIRFLTYNIVLAYEQLKLNKCISVNKWCDLKSEASGNMK